MSLSAHGSIGDLDYIQHPDFVRTNDQDSGLCKKIIDLYSTRNFCDIF